MEMSLGSHAAGLLYRAHWTSISLWIATGVHVLRRQKAIIPSEWDYFGVRFFLAYTLCDAIRSFDLCVDSSVGVCFAVWGICPLWIKLAVWWLRDAILFTAVSFYLHFVLGWSHAALGQAVPRGLHGVLLGASLTTILILAGCFVQIVATNRQSWQAISGLCVVLLNVPWTCLNWYLLKSVLPAVRSSVASGMYVSGLKENNIENSKLVVLASSTLRKAQLASCLVFVVNISIMVMFPLITIQKLFYRNAHNQAVVPSLSLDTWAGHATLPELTSLSLGVTLNPLLELVELSIGWGQCVQCLAVGILDENFQIVNTRDGTKTPYASLQSIGSLFKRLARKED